MKCASAFSIQHSAFRLSPSPLLLAPAPLAPSPSPYFAPSRSPAQSAIHFADTCRLIAKSPAQKGGEGEEIESQRHFSGLIDCLMEKVSAVGQRQEIGDWAQTDQRGQRKTGCRERASEAEEVREGLRRKTSTETAMKRPRKADEIMISTMAEAGCPIECLTGQPTALP